METELKMLVISILDKDLNITNLRLQTHLPGDNELKQLLRLFE